MVVSFCLTFKVLYNKINVDINNSIYLDYLLNDSMSLDTLEDIGTLSSMEFLLKYSFGIDNINNGIDNVVNNSVIEYGEIKEENNPLVYIYNSHQTEGYKSNLVESFNINNTVFLASHILGEYLRDLGIGVIVEENSIVDVLNTNGWKYGSSYKASRILMENAYKENPSLMFFVDVHRDSASYERTMVELDNVKYAKVMFVVGLEHNNYEVNLKLANMLNDELNNRYKGLSRGVLEKKGAGVNGVYNQDFHPNTVLIEVGGQYNYIEEVNNTMKVLASLIYDYVKGEIE